MSHKGPLCDIEALGMSANRCGERWWVVPTALVGAVGRRPTGAQKSQSSSSVASAVPMT